METFLVIHSKPLVSKGRFGGDAIAVPHEYSSPNYGTTLRLNGVEQHYF